MKSTLAATLMFSASLLLSSHAAAEEAVDGTDEGGQTERSVSVTSVNQGSDPSASANSWDVSIMPYVWMAGMKGTIGVPRTSGEIDIDQSFADTLSKLNFAAMATIDARHDRVVLLGDVIYLSVGAEAKGIRDPQFLSGSVDASVFIASGAAGYRVVDQGPMFIDVFAGGRLIALDSEVELVGPLATRSASESATTVAPLVGARLHAPLSPKLTLGLYGDAGGFVKGADVKWQLMADLQYQLGSKWSAVLGYRYMAINHDSARFDFDIDMSGPMLGFSRKF